MSEILTMTQKEFDAHLNVAHAVGSAAAMESFAATLLEASGEAFARRRDERAGLLREVSGMAIERGRRERKRLEELRAKRDHLTKDGPGEEGTKP